MMRYFLVFPADGGHEDGHQGTDEVEETVGEIGEGGDAKNGGLRHAASVLGNEYGGDANRRDWFLIPLAINIKVDECRFSVHRIHVRKVFPVFAITAITCAITINFIATY